jgi:formylglycine-generating enzyme required for sulfatase activity
MQKYWSVVVSAVVLLAVIFVQYGSYLRNRSRISRVDTQVNSLQKECNYLRDMLSNLPPSSISKEEASLLSLKVEALLSQIEELRKRPSISSSPEIKDLMSILNTHSHELALLTARQNQTEKLCGLLEAQLQEMKAKTPSQNVSDTSTSVEKAVVSVKPSLPILGRSLGRGEFWMGSPEDEPGRCRYPGRSETRHLVTLTRPFYLGKYEVTQAQYQAVMGANPSPVKGPNLPVVNMYYLDAAAFCKKLSEMVGAEFRLPTEAEWEYACRAGSTSMFCFGDEEKDLAQYAQYTPSTWGGTRFVEGQALPVGQKKPNAWGFYDMHGNVSEWVLDFPTSHPSEPVTDPFGREASCDRLHKGGDWQRSAAFCRSAARGWVGQGTYGATIGFRVAMLGTTLKGKELGKQVTLNLGKGVILEMLFVSLQ